LWLPLSVFSLLGSATHGKWQLIDGEAC
jgi:hypothetical protein